MHVLFRSFYVVQYVVCYRPGIYLVVSNAWLSDLLHIIVSCNFSGRREKTRGCRIDGQHKTERSITKRKTWKIRTAEKCHCTTSNVICKILVNIIEIQSRKVIKKFTTEKLSLEFWISGKIWRDSWWFEELSWDRGRTEESASCNGGGYDKVRNWKNATTCSRGTFIVSLV